MLISKEEHDWLWNRARIANLKARRVFLNKAAWRNRERCAESLMCKKNDVSWKITSMAAELRYGF